MADNPALGLRAIRLCLAEPGLFHTQLRAILRASAHGHQHFQTLCLPCHRVRGEGHELGPDLAMVGSKDIDWLLHAILDPGQAVEARYRAWTIALKSGETIDGIISAETANNLVVRMAGGAEHAVLRGDISTMSPMKGSLMPDGFES